MISQEGQHFASYADMCRKRDMPILSGNSKKAQLKDLELNNTIKRDTQGNGFCVTPRKEPKPKQDKRSQKTGAYSELVDSIVLYGVNHGFSGESMQLIRLDIFKSMEYIYGISKEGNMTPAYKETLGSNLYDYADKEIISFIYRHITSSIKRLQRRGIIEFTQYYELKDGDSTPEMDLEIAAIKSKILSENNIRNEYVLECLVKDSIREFVHKEFKQRLKDMLGIVIKRKVTYIELTNGKAKIPNPKQYKDCCVVLYALMKSYLIGRARKKYSVNMDEETRQIIELLGETEIQKLEKFYEEHITYVS